MAMEPDAEKTQRTTEGALALRAYLEARKLSITAFCDSKGLDRVQVQRILSGERGQRVTVKFARAIERATDGEVAIGGWADEVTPAPSDSSPALEPVDATGDTVPAGATSETALSAGATAPDKVG